MNIFTNHPDAALLVARHTIADRVGGAVGEAGVRARLRGLRSERRATRPAPTAP